ncbi:hypothetical protein F4825DRAFT_447415 [Nemania diffusa]|nr:hypothetical protein F4825DRAFT_447415 [Nemania diffusa]
MYFSTIFGLFLAALVTAAPSSSHNGQGTIVTQKRGLVTFVMTEPDCPSLKSYCTTCNEFVPFPHFGPLFTPPTLRSVLPFVDFSLLITPNPPLFEIDIPYYVIP